MQCSAKISSTALISLLVIFAPILPIPVLAEIQISQLDRRAADVDRLLIQGSEELDRQEFKAAVQSYQQALQGAQALQDDERTVSAQNGLAKAWLLLKNYPEAIRLLQPLAVHPLPNVAIRSSILSHLGLALFLSGQPSEAEQALRQSIAGWESVRTLGDISNIDKVTLFEQQGYTYRLLQKVLVAQNKTNAALEIAEWSRARALIELLAQRTSANATLPQASPPTLSQIQQIAKTHNTTLVEYSVVGNEARILGTELENETDLFIWVVRPSGEVAFRQVDLKSLGQGIDALNRVSVLASLVRDGRNSLGVGSRGLIFQENSDVVARVANSSEAILRSNQQLQQLHKLLIQPIAELLPTDPEARVTFIPQGPLFLVPFAALQDAAGKYLIEKHTVLTAPSVQLLELTRQQQQRVRNAQGNALVVGNPVMPSLPAKPGDRPQQLASLPGAEQEAKVIAPLLKTEALIGKQATKSAVMQLMPQQRIIHLATHGIFDLDVNLNEFGVPIDPKVRTARQSGVNVMPGAVVVGSGTVLIGGVPAEAALAREKVVRVEMPGLIALTPSGGDDGFLSAKEILQMQLNADLVVLSACNTGRGRVTGDGVIGLSRALIAAGAPSVIVSLWAVPDAPTASLMATFYQKLQQKQDKAQALRQAMLTTLKQHPDPKDWAAFTLIGEAE